MREEEGHPALTAAIDDEFELLCAGVRIREVNDLAEGWLWIQARRLLLIADALSAVERCQALRWALDRLR